MFKAGAQVNKYVAHAQALETTTWDIQHLACIITLKTGIGKAKCPTRINKHVFYVPDAMFESHASRRMACLNNRRQKMRARKCVIYFDISELATHTNKRATRSFKSTLRCSMLGVEACANDLRDHLKLRKASEGKLLELLANLFNCGHVSKRPSIWSAQSVSRQSHFCQKIAFFDNKYLEVTANMVKREQTQGVY